MRKKTFIRFMCVVLVALLLTPSISSFCFTLIASEVPTETIREIKVEIEVPAGGRVPSFEATALPSSMLEYKIANSNYEYDSEYYHNFYKHGIQWYDIDNGRALKEGEAFVTGIRYRADIVINQTYRTDMNGLPYYEYADNLKGYVNGAEAVVKNSVLALDTRWFRQLSYTFPPCEDAPDDITSISLWLDSPVANAKPDFTYTTKDKGYKSGAGVTDAINGIMWYDSRGNTMTADSKFVEDETYTAAIELKAISPYMFATNADGSSKVSATINGNTAEVYCNAQIVEDMDKNIWVRYTFTKCKKIINSVELMNFELPQEGKKGNISICSPDNSIYKVEAITWESANGTIAVWNGKTNHSSQTGVFEAGVTYTVTVTLVASADYAFATDTNSKTAVTASGAGFELEVTEHHAYSADSYIMVSGRFICRQTYVNEVNITNLEEPVAGKRPDYSVNSIGIGYRIETEREAKDSVWLDGQYVDLYYKFGGVAWYDLNESRYIYENETFIQGHVYTVYIDIVADSSNGYEFKLDNEGYSESNVIAYVNENQALAVSKTTNAFWNQYIEYTVSCPYVFEAIKGDVNGDGEVDSGDATMILKYDAGMIDLTDEQIAAGDINGDGESDSLDATMILKYDAGMMDEL